MAELQAKLLHHLGARKTENHGFTLIELLVVIIIIGILSAIALPSFLRYANRARESEAKTYVGTINIAQQAYLIEHDQFTTLENLGLAIPSNTAYYVYDSVAVGNGLNEVANTTATPIFDTARGYTGKVWTAPGLDGNATSWAIVCEGDMGTVPVIAATTCPP